MTCLLDTNVLSEVRKGHRCHPRVRQWFAGTRIEELFTSVLVLGEIKRGIESLRSRDVEAASALDRWLQDLGQDFEQRILPVTLEIAFEWGRLDHHRQMPPIDGLLAATALHHRLTLVTRNTRDVSRSGVACFNPFVA